MDYFSLKCFIEVVRSKSFSVAARKLFRTQPAISLQIRKLEKELKQPLLNRYKKQVSLTETGQIVYNEAKGLLDRMDDLKRLALDNILQPQGSLTIASNLSLINNFLPPIIGKFHKKYPQVRIILLNLTNDEILKTVMEGTVEIGLGYFVKETPEIITRKIRLSEFILVSKKSSLRQKKLLSMKEIVNGPLIHFEEKIDLRNYIEHNLKLKKTLQTVIELPSIESILNYIKYGFGYSILPEFAILKQWRKELWARKLSNFIKPIAISTYTHRKRILTKAAEEFLKLL